MVPRSFVFTNRNYLIFKKQQRICRSVNSELANAETGGWNGVSLAIYVATLWLVCNRPLLLQSKVPVIHFSKFKKKKPLPRILQNDLKNWYRIGRNKRSPQNKRPPKTVVFPRGEYTKPMAFDGWFFRGGSTQNRWGLMGDFPEGGVHKTDGFWWVIFQRGEYTKPMGFDGWVFKGGSTQNQWGLMGFGNFFIASKN